jgi:hypothetical protein
VQRAAATYEVTTAIETDRGRGETRRIGPARIMFVTDVLFATGEPLRFALTLRGTGTAPLTVAGDGSVSAVSRDGARYLVDAAIDRTYISLAPSPHPGRGEGDEND